MKHDNRNVANHSWWRGTAWSFLKRPPWRTVVPAGLLLLIAFIGHVLWQPGRDVTDGRHDRGSNGIWLQHGWLGDDAWFRDNDRWERRSRFRSDANVRALGASLKQRRIRDVFPHLCPTLPSGAILPVDEPQTERFLNGFAGFRVLPWVGGVLNEDVDPDNARRRGVFVQSVAALLHRHPRLAGVHLNVEPWPSGNRSLLLLLDELRRALPPGKILSVAAYPPPTRWHPYPDVHWDEAYFKEVARRVDQMVVMQYDTGLRDGKMYQALMRTWTQQVLEWADASGRQPPAILIGVPTYQDEGVGSHHPDVENLVNGLMGVHTGLDRFPRPPRSYQGVAVYCEWETSDDEWRHWQQHFAAPSDNPTPR